MKIEVPLSIGLALTLLCGCAHVQPGVSSMNFTPEAMQIVGPAKGESTETYFLCLIPFDFQPASVVDATNRAIKSVRADALINTVVDDERGFALLACWQTIRVSGTAVKFKRESYATRASAIEGKDNGGTIESMERILKGN